MIPWFWRTEQMPAREVEQLTLRQADAFTSGWAAQQQPATPAGKRPSRPSRPGTPPRGR